ncbi:MAG: bifunctional diaminohydroxyphosphoribosylaminopyrimidine deaminase/5-amino-6-(5-phosphoribosylamino)uracil reductase RibD [Candidatus Omnitrophota bacterium]|nr:bifunctional diaminohydroxyphosphoribosylaminopyrimidine deaminase/5-amino-6-(5-phosphoribosylamino)uracil reductase RibD [Candidatus Omnitrophota bacterium]
MNPDVDYMIRACELAWEGRGKTSPNPMVGALIVKNGRIIAEGWHRRCGGPHAEIIALKNAGSAARGATLYVTLEPCAHSGRTPPCVDAVVASGIRQVVIGMTDPNPLTNGKSVRKLRRAGIRVRTGVLEKEIRAMNEAFVTYIKRRKPFVVAKTAQTIDGRIASRSGDSKWISSAEARAHTRGLRAYFDAILVGIGTVLKDDPGLNPTHRLKRFRKVVVDSRLRIPPNAKLFRKTAPEDCIIATTARASRRKVDILRQRGVTVAVCPSRSGRVDLAWLMRYLAEQEISHLLIEGGGSVIGSALKARLVDKMMIVIAARVTGDEKAKPSVQGLSAPRVGDFLKLRDYSVKQIGGDLVIEGAVDYPPVRKRT